MTDKITSAVDDALERIDGQWDEDDPEVLRLPGEREPVVADVDGELRTLHNGLIYAAPLEREGIVEYCEEQGETPTVEDLSEFTHRFDKKHFEELHPDSEADSDD